MFDKFVTFGVISELLYLSFYLIKRFVGDEFSLELTGALLLLMVVYYLGFRVVEKYKVSIKQIVIFSILFNLTLLFIWKLPSDDLFTYIYRSRIYTKYNSNPYLISYDSYSTDLFFGQLKTAWSGKTVIYGPAVMVLGSILSFVARDNLFINIYLFRTFFVFLNLANIFLIYKITKNKRAVYLYAWNPIILFEFVLNNHLDLIMIFFFLFSIFFLFKHKKLQHHLLGWGLFVTSILTKFFTAIFAPFVYVEILRRLKKTKYYSSIVPRKRVLS